MTDKRPKYDLAISFLHRDEPLALEIFGQLSGELDTFVYSKKQEELAGTNGLEAFREAFRTESRLVVVLYRKGWGETPWTRVEQAAITDRMLIKGWDFLLFVSLDDADEPPVWLPKSEIRLSFQQYGLDQLLGAIKVRAQKVGTVVRQETTAERAKRFEQQSQAKVSREQLLESEGYQGVHNEFRALLEFVRAHVENANQHLTVKIETGFAEDVFTMRAQNVSINFYLYQTYPIPESRVVVQDWKGRLSLGSSGAFYFREPQVIGEDRFYFDYQSSHGWCWHREGSKELLTSDQLAQKLVARLLQLQENHQNRKNSWNDE